MSEESALPLKQPRKSGHSARAVALDLLDGVLRQGRMLSDMAGLAERCHNPSDRARARRLVTDVLRHLGGIDALLSPHLRKLPPFRVYNVLRLAVMELLLKEAPYGVVNEAVKQVRKGGHKIAHLSGLVNAVLRRVLSDLPALEDLPVSTIPVWLREPLVQAYGEEVTCAIEVAHAAVAPVDVTLKAPEETGFHFPDAKRLPNESLRLGVSAGKISSLPGYDAGDWWVQDVAASMAVSLLAPKPGEKILDLCAAPGGKTMQLAAAGADVTALDISKTRMMRVRENLSRTRLTANLVVADALKWPDAPQGGFDAILLDAPCSATGTIRRHPDLPYVKNMDDVVSLASLQTNLLERALGWLRSGGRLVFCTCSLLPEEGEMQLEAVLERHLGLEVALPEAPWFDPSWITVRGGVRLRPDYWLERGGMDGFFMACLSVPAGG